MLRSILSAILGYVIMFLFIAVTFAAAWLLLGSSFAFEPGTVDVTIGWIVVALVLSVVAALAGGLVAKKIGGDSAVRILAGIILILGLLSAVMVTVAPRELPEDFDVEAITVMDAGNYAQNPAWYNFALPFVGVGGVMLGGRMLKAPGPARAPDTPA